MFLALKKTNLITIFLLATSCAGSGGGSLQGNDGGSGPINSNEEVAYKKALLKCYKTGGNRVVKIEGRLRCF